MNKLNNLLQNTYNNHIFPLFWQMPDVSEEDLRRDIREMQNSGIGAFCIESRIHPDFGKERWWHDLDIIFDEAKKRNMKIWLLDDANFPSGLANYYIRDKYPHLRKWIMTERHIDIFGPVTGGTFMVDAWLEPKHEESIIAIIACKRRGNEKAFDDPIDITTHLKNGVLYWEVPEGTYRIFYMIKTRNQYTQDQEFFVDPLSSESTDVMVEAIYETHYEHYKDYFGTTFLGFFSDEPRFGNGGGVYTAVGNPGSPFSWRDDLPDMIKTIFEDNSVCYLPALWYDLGEKTELYRYAYMDIVTKLYKKNYADKFGTWCEDHGVEYIGHAVDDNNGHTRMGSCAGHFFRGMAGQHMAGADTVLHQVVPGFDDSYSTWVAGDSDARFFNYGNVKLCASLAHLHKNKKGRAMIEIFGAYGWAAGLKMQKWLVDHMAVRGMNQFCPHAWSPKYPNEDCPPHFYAEGNNPQYPYFKSLMDYTNRLSNLFNDGLHIAPVAVLYHAEAEWSNNKAYMPSDEPMMHLMKNQIDADIVPIDSILEDSTIKNKCMCINGEEYKCLVIPYSYSLPAAFLYKIKEYSDSGLNIVFINEYPKKSIENKKFDLCGKKVLIDELIDYLKQNGIYEIKYDKYIPFVKYYHYVKDGVDYFMFFNEHLNNFAETTVKIPIIKNVFEYDAFTNEIYKSDYTQDTSYTYLNLKLAPFEAKVFVMDKNKFELELKNHIIPSKEMLLDEKWKVSVATIHEYPNFNFYKNITQFINITDYNELPDFSGFIRYEKTVEICFDIKEAALVLTYAGEVADVYINGVNVGARYSNPYEFDITKCVKQGTNTIIIDVVNTLVFNQKKDYFSKYLPVYASGLMGNVKINIK